MPRIFSILAVIVLIVTVPMSSAATENDCGLNCMQGVCDYWGIDITRDQLAEKLGYNPEFGVSMLDLYIASLELDLPAHAVNTSINDLRDMEYPRIVFVKDNHFMLLHGCTDSEVFLQDYPGPVFPVNIGDFNKHWSGEALVYSHRIISHNALTPSSSQTYASPHIDFFNTTFEAGNILSGTVLHHVFHFQNTGSRPLKVHIRSTCSCTALLLSESVVQPGCYGKISVEFVAEGSPGMIEQSIMVRTSDPDNPYTTLSVTAHIEPIVVAIPNTVWIDEVLPDTEVYREVQLLYPDRPFDIAEIRAGEGVEIQPKEGYFIDDMYHIPLGITLHAGSSIGDFHETVVIVTEDSISHEIPIDIYGKIRPSIKVMPKTILFNEVVAGSIQTRVATLFPSDSEMETITKIETNNDNITATVQINENDTMQMTALFHVPSSSDLIEGTIDMYNQDGQLLISVPYYAKISLQRLQELP